MSFTQEAVWSSCPGAITEAAGGCKDHDVKGRAIMRKLVGAELPSGISSDSRTMKEVLGRRKVRGEMISKTASVRFSSGPGQWYSPAGPVSIVPKEVSKNSTWLRKLSVGSGTDPCLPIRRRKRVGPTAVLEMFTRITTSYHVAALRSPSNWRRPPWHATLPGHPPANSTKEEQSSANESWLRVFSS